MNSMSDRSGLNSTRTCIHPIGSWSPGRSGDASVAVPRQAVIREPEIAGAPSRSFAVEQKAESSGSLTGHGRGHGCEFAELVPWQPVSDECDFRSARRSADPQPVAIQVANLELAPV